MNETKSKINYKLIALQAGERLYGRTTYNAIQRAADSISTFPINNYESVGITSTKYQLIYDWILTIANQQNLPDDRKLELVRKFLLLIDMSFTNELNNIIDLAQDKSVRISESPDDEIYKYKFHPEIVKHCEKLFRDHHYMHAVLEASKSYNNYIKYRINGLCDGQALMAQAFPSKISDNNFHFIMGELETETGKNLQDGFRFLSMGAIAAFRNPTAHETVSGLEISQQDCIDILHLISYLFRKVEKASMHPF